MSGSGFPVNLARTLVANKYKEPTYKNALINGNKNEVVEISEKQENELLHGGEENQEPKMSSVEKSDQDEEVKTTQIMLKPFINIKIKMVSVESETKEIADESSHLEYENKMADEEGYRNGPTRPPASELNSETNLEDTVDNSPKYLTPQEYAKQEKTTESIKKLAVRDPRLRQNALPAPMQAKNYAKKKKKEQPTELTPSPKMAPENSVVAKGIQQGHIIKF